MWHSIVRIHCLSLSCVREPLRQLAQTHACVDSAIVRRRLKRVEIDLLPIHPYSAQVCHQRHLQVDQDIFHLLPCLDIPTSIWLAESLQVMVVVAANNDWTERK